MKKLIIIPAYNEEANIVKTVESIERDAVGFDYIVINDCSTDRTKEICEEHGFHYVDLPINLGMRRVGIRFFSGLIRLMTGKTITDPTSGLRMAGRNVIELFSKDYPRDYPEPESVVAILRKGLKVAEVPVIMREREGGVSSISMKKSVYYMVKVTLAILIERIRR